MPTVLARWRDWAVDGLEHRVLREDDDGVSADSVVIGDAEGERYAARCRIKRDRAWRTSSLEMIVFAAGRFIAISGDCAGEVRM